MAELPESGIDVLKALIGASLAWQTPAQVAVALSRDLDETSDLLCDLDIDGWLDVWEDQNGPLITLSALAAERLCVRIVEFGPSETPRWASLGDPEPPAPRSRSVCTTDRGAGLDYVVDPMSSDDFLSQADSSEIASNAGARPTSRPLHEPRPSLLIGLGLSPWPGLSAPPRAGCPVCAGRALRTCMYCLYCDRWGLDRPATPGRDAFSPEMITSRSTREVLKKVADEQVEMEQQRARRKSKRRRNRDRAQKGRELKAKIGSPTSKNEQSPLPKKSFDLGLAGPPRGASLKRDPTPGEWRGRPGHDSTGIAGRSAR